MKLFILSILYIFALVSCVPQNAITVNSTLKNDQASSGDSSPPSLQAGCTDHLANNFDSTATSDDSSCTYSPPRAILATAPGNISQQDSSITNFTVSFENSLDSGEYQFKIIDPVNDCTDPLGYSDFISTSLAITENVSSFSSTVQPNTKLCLIARSSNLKNPSRAQLTPTEYTWNTDLSVSGPTGCMDIGASNYDSSARVNDSSVCTYLIYGCMDPNANNYNSSATVSSTCSYNVYGCTNPSANNYDMNANTDDGSCAYADTNIYYGCTDPSANNYNSSANSDDGSCSYTDNNVYGCTNPSAKNYNSSANSDDGSCVFFPHASISSAPSVINFDNQSSPPMVIFNIAGMSNSYRYRTYTHTVPSCDSADPSVEQVVNLGSDPLFELSFPNFDAGYSNSTEQNSRVCIVACSEGGGDSCEAWSDGATATWASDFIKPQASIQSWSAPGDTFSAIVSSSADTAYYLYKVVRNYGDGMSDCQDSTEYRVYQEADHSHIEGNLDTFGDTRNNNVRLCVLAVDYAGNIQDYNDAAYSNLIYYYYSITYGCTDPSANNYNSSANSDDGSCSYTDNNVIGCTNPSANNYNSSANSDDGSCSYTDPCEGSNYTNFGCPGYVAPPVAIISGAPSRLNISTASSMDYITVSSESADSHYYRYKVFSSNYDNCSNPMNYSSFPILLNTPIYWTDLQLASLGSNSSSPNNTICVVVDDISGFTQYENPASVSWLADFEAPSISGMEVEYSSIPNPLTNWTFYILTHPQNEMAISHYKYKLMVNDGLSCANESESGYVDTPGATNSYFEVSLEAFGMGTADVKMCILAVDYAGNVQSLNTAYSTVIHFVAPQPPISGGSFSAGDGTDAYPYEIWTAADLELIRSTGDYSYKLMADIDLSGVNFSPLFSGDMYTRTFNGNNKTISNWNYLNPTADAVGFFSKLHVGTIKDLTIANSKVYGSSYVGTLAGINEGGNISNCHVTNGEVNAPIEGDYGAAVGGLVGSSNGGTISHSSSQANVSARYVVGGLVGISIGTTITTSYTGGNVSAYNSYVGGFVGSFSNENSSYIANSYAGSNVDAHNGGGCHGGFIGYLDKKSSTTTISNSYSSAYMISSGGGFAGCVINYYGYAGYAVENSFSVGQVQSTNSAFAEIVYYNASMQNIYFDATASGQSQCFPQASAFLCVAITSNPDYFTTDLTQHAPTSSWDFGSIWQENPGSMPTLR